MSEEDILKECTELAENEHHELGDCWDEEYSSSAIFGLIMLYKQTKKELNSLKEIEQLHQEENGKLRVELEKEKEKNKELSDKLTEKICKGAEESILEEYRQQIKDLKEKNEELEKHQKQYLDGELITAKQGKFFKKMIKENYISKDKIRKFIEEELPEEEICNTCEIYDVNGISIKEKLEKILTES